MRLIEAVHLACRSPVVIGSVLMAALPASAQTLGLFSPTALEQMRGAEELPIGEGGPPEPAIEVAPPPAASAAEIEAWRSDLVGKPVFGAQGGSIGTITELSISLDNRVGAAVVTVPSGARLPVPWRWVESQLGRPTVLVPWSAADIAWLQGAHGRR